MLEEEATRYGLDVNLGGLRAQGASSSNIFCFGRSPEREGYDHSGVRREGILLGSGSRRPSAENIQGKGMAVGTWLRSTVSTLWVEIRGGLQTKRLVKRAGRKTSSIGRKAV